MNQKKCPKCGENNPAEAVMCWACYTPLSGGATVAAGPGGATTMAGSGTAVAHKEESEKKPVAPWQIGVIVGALLLGLGFGAYTMMNSGSTTEEFTVTTTGGDPTSSYSGEGTTPVVNDGPAPVPGSGGTVGGPVEPRRAPYTMVAPPNVRMSWGVMAIVPNNAGTSAQSAAQLAKFARNQYNMVRSWQGMHIYVFADTASAQQFNEFQGARSHAPLGPAEYTQLAQVWPKCLARYEYRNGQPDRFVYPSRNPESWWRAR